MDKATFILQASKENVMLQIINGKAQLKYSGGNSDAFALIIDGKSLAYALDDDIKHIFLELAVGCASVICCRSSPKQKALVHVLYLFLWYNTFAAMKIFSRVTSKCR